MDQDNQFNAVPEEGVPAPALDAQTVKYLLFCSDNLLFGVSADYVVEIITNHAITKLPLVPNYIRGIINLRGQIIPIVDIRLLLGQPSQSDNCIIILNIEDTLVGILVDTVQKMIDVDTALILPSPSQDTRNLVSGMCSLSEEQTFFMREPDHFTFFRDVILPELSRRHQKDRVLSIWSAGCSSGEEPYTLSIYLKEFFGPQASQWDTRILATDISQQALSKAKAGQYKLPADMPGEWLKRYFVKDDATCLYTAAPQLKQNVIFRTFNLMDPIHFRLKFDVIFCRNVMIYFDQATRDALVRRFYDALHPTGYLFISHSESLGQTRLFRTAAPAVYQKLPLGTHQ